MRRIGLFLSLALAMAALCAGTASAASTSVGCGEQELEQPFLRFLDPLFYVLAPNGNLESGSKGWTLSGGAKVVSGNAPYSDGSSSLYLPGGSSATTPATCVGLLHPTLRFHAKGQLLSGLKVEMLYTGLLGVQTSVELLPGYVGSGVWDAGFPLVHLGSALPATSLDGLSADVRFRFTPRRGFFSTPSWRIDDVYVDPFKLF